MNENHARIRGLIDTMATTKPTRAASAAFQLHGLIARDPVANLDTLPGDLLLAARSQVARIRIGGSELWLDSLADWLSEASANREIAAAIVDATAALDAARERGDWRGVAKYATQIAELHERAAREESARAARAFRASGFACD